MDITERLAKEFRARFGVEPQLFRAPGRVNLIGEHTDYNDGFVLPAALDLATYAAIAPRRDRRMRVSSLDVQGGAEFDLNAPAAPRRDWTDYVRGVVCELERDGVSLSGADILVATTLPMGAGLSTSAALEVCVGYGLLSLHDGAIDRLALATLCQRAENNFVGMRCGIMDQFISCFGEAGAALLLDCRTLQARPVKVDPAIRLMICNTMAHHHLATSAFNQRRRECEDAVARLARALRGLTSLRDVSPEDVEAHAGLLPDPLLQRARHVTQENARVLATVAALEAGDYLRVGRLMNQSHDSLRDNYAVSCAELDLMTELARGVDGVYGARMTGGGFGGCTVNLVAAEAAERFAATVGPAYAAVTGFHPMIFSCVPAAGAGRVTLGQV